MAALGSRGHYGTIADGGLIASIVVAPLAGGSVRLVMLPILAVLASVAFGATVLGRASAGRRQHVSLLPVGFLVAALFTLLQAVPLPPALLALLSPRAHELRAHVGALESWAPLTYEPAATLRLAGLFALYAMIAHVAYERAGTKRGFAFVARAVLGAALASLVVAALHRVTGTDHMLGVLDSARPASQLLTTFVNPNHGAGFMLLAALIAIGLAAGVRTRRDRVRYFGAAMAAAAASALCVSRGGLVALVVGFALFVALTLTRKAKELEDRESNLPAVVGVMVTVLFAGIAWRYAELLREFTGTEEDPLGVDGKVAAARDAGGLILDHPLFGIGRGSYGSVYAGYKTAPHQFTYSHPENLAVQLISDWGLPLGIAALAAFAWVVYSRVKDARNVGVLGAVVGVAALSLQNLVDFSLELPGVALPVAAILGASGVGRVRERRFELRRAAGMAFALLPALVLWLATAGALSAPDLETDLKALADGAWSKERGALARLEHVAVEHPANAVIAARMAYAAETAEPPDYRMALRWANRTMYLAPMYADGHLMAGRLLLRFGHRTQGFTEMRRAWALVLDGAHRTVVLDHIMKLARTPEEVLEAIPRRDEVMDEPDEKELGTAVIALVELGKPEWARALLTSVPRIENVPPASLVSVAMAAIAVDDHDLAERALLRRREMDPSDAWALKSLVEMLVRKGDTDAAHTLISEALTSGLVDPAAFLKARLDLALRADRMDEAREAVEDMRRRLPPTQKNQVFIARMRSKVEQKDNQPIAAVRALDDAIRLAPESADLRVERAQLLLRQGKSERARMDLVAALRLSPNHSGAKTLLGRLSVEDGKPQ